MPSKYLLVFPTPSLSYLSVKASGGVNAYHNDGISGDLLIFLGVGEVGGD